MTKRSVSAKNQQTIESERQEPTFFAMIPKMAIMDLNPYELALYCNYKQTVGENRAGKCTKTNATLSRETHMSVNRMKDARASLEAKRYIFVQHHTEEDGSENIPPTVIVRDVWAINHQIFSVSLYEGVSNGDTPPSGNDTPPDHKVTPPLSGGDTKEEPYKKNQNKEKKKKPTAPVNSADASEFTHAQKSEMIAAWWNALPVKPGNRTYAQNFKINANFGYALNMLNAGLTTYQVEVFVKGQTAPKGYYHDKSLTFLKVAQDCGAWCAANKIPAQPIIYRVEPPLESAPVARVDVPMPDDPAEREAVALALLSKIGA